MTLGDILQQLCQSARQKLCLVAPFIKVATLQRLLENISPDVKVQCITRWRPEEIVMGVSDIEVWTLLKQRENSQLWLRSDLHAKYYRADAQCFVGSANITSTALGWSSKPNLEILIDVSLQHPALVGFEENLLSGCIAVNDDIYQHTQSVVAILADEKTPFINSVELAPSVEDTVIQRECWIPTLRNPEQLYIAYSGKFDRLTNDVYKSALADLYVLKIPSGLSKQSFEAYVGYVLLQMPMIRKVDAFVAQARRFGEVAAYLRNQPCAVSLDFDAKYAWQTLMRWLLFYLSNRYLYQKPQHSELFYRVPK